MELADLLCVANRYFYNILMLVLLSHAIFCIQERILCYHHPDDSCLRERIVLNTAERELMKLTIDRVSLLRPLGHVQSVVERRNTIPILANVVLRAEDGQL